MAMFASGGLVAGAAAVNPLLRLLWNLIDKN
jgi:hypothetical protein